MLTKLYAERRYKKTQCVFGSDDLDKLMNSVHQNKKKEYDKSMFISGFIQSLHKEDSQRTRDGKDLNFDTEGHHGAGWKKEGKLKKI